MLHRDPQQCLVLLLPQSLFTDTMVSARSTCPAILGQLCQVLLVGGPQNLSRPHMQPLTPFWFPYLPNVITHPPHSRKDSRKASVTPGKLARNLARDTWSQSLASLRSIFLTCKRCSHVPSSCWLLKFPVLLIYTWLRLVLSGNLQDSHMKWQHKNIRRHGYRSKGCRERTTMGEAGRC